MLPGFPVFLDQAGIAELWARMDCCFVGQLLNDILP